MKKLILLLMTTSVLFADTFIISQDNFENTQSSNNFTITKLCQDNKVITVVTSNKGVSLLQNLEQYDDGDVEIERCQRDFKDSSQLPKE